MSCGPSVAPPWPELLGRRVAGAALLKPEADVTPAPAEPAARKPDARRPGPVGKPSVNRPRAHVERRPKLHLGQHVVVSVLWALHVNSAFAILGAAEVVRPGDGYGLTMRKL
jgi:hypothetical protein